jgi:hypothetical protein
MPTSESRHANNVRKTECNFCECFAHAWAPTTKWGVVLVDIADAGLLMDDAWSMICPNRRSPYAHSRKGGGYLHCAILGTKGIDHINGNGFDCRRRNLRLATQRQNTRNKSSARSSTSRFLGVSKCKGGSWVAQIRANGKNTHLGYFDREENAAQAYNFAALEYFGEFARYNVA